MKRYEVKVSYRPHVSSLKREEAVFYVTAPNKNVAVLRAGWLMRNEEHWHIAESLQVEVSVA